MHERRTSTRQQQTGTRSKRQQLTRTRFSLAFLIVIGFCAAGCNSNSPWVRNNSLVRWMYYPPVVEGMGAGLGNDSRGTTFDHGDYAALLRDIVDANGEVDYLEAEARQERLDAYLAQIAKADRRALTRYEDIALLLNAYNACTIRLVLDHPGIASVDEIPKAERWQAKRWTIGGEVMSLDHLEHKILRPLSTEPRIHFAIVKAARSCPVLRPEPYVGAKLDAQLESQARHFFSRSDTTNLEVLDQELHVSELLDWYKSDFTAGGRPLREVVRQYAPEWMAVQIGAMHRRTEVLFLPFDSSLNGRWR